MQAGHHSALTKAQQTRTAGHSRDCSVTHEGIFQQQCHWQKTASELGESNTGPEAPNGTSYIACLRLGGYLSASLAAEGVSDPCGAATGMLTCSGCEEWQEADAFEGTAAAIKAAAGSEAALDDSCKAELPSMLSMSTHERGHSVIKQQETGLMSVQGRTSL